MLQDKKSNPFFLTRSFVVTMLGFVLFSLITEAPAIGQEWTQWAACGDNAGISKEPVEYRFKSGGITVEKGREILPLTIEYRNKTDYTWEFDNVVSLRGDIGGATMKPVARNYRQIIAPRETKSVTQNIEAGANLVNISNVCSDYTRAYWIPLVVKGWQSADSACGNIVGKGDQLSDDLTEASLGASSNSDYKYFSVGECIRVQEKVSSFD